MWIKDGLSIFVSLLMFVAGVDGFILKTFHPSLPSFNNNCRTSTSLDMGVRGKRYKKEANRARQRPTPPVQWTPYGAIRQNPEPKVCVNCKGRGVVRCNVCGGAGVIEATGNRKFNQVNVNRVVGSRWTSVEIRNGHRQHTVMEMRGSKKKDNLEFRMINNCGESKSSWVSYEELRNKYIWRAGWTTLQDIKKANKGPLLDQKMCFLCKGGRIMKCAECDGQGQVDTLHVVYD